MSDKGDDLGYKSWGSLHKQDIEQITELLDELEKNFTFLNRSMSSKKSKRGKLLIERNKEITTEIHRVLFEAEQQHPSTANHLTSASPFSSREQLRIQKALAFLQLNEEKLTTTLDAPDLGQDEYLVKALRIQDVEEWEPSTVVPNLPALRGLLVQEQRKHVEKAISNIPSTTLPDLMVEEPHDLLDLIQHLAP